MNGNGSGSGDYGGNWYALLRGKYKKPPPKMVTAFFKAYAEVTALDATKAAAIAGYKFPNTESARLVKKHSDVAEACKISWHESCGVKPNELVQHLAEIVRDKDHKDRMKAIELNAKIHGMLSEKHIIELDKNSLLKQIDARIQQLTEARALETGVIGAALPEKSGQEPS